METIKRTVEVNTRFQQIGLGFTAVVVEQKIFPMKRIFILLPIAALLWLPLTADAQTAGTKPADPNPQAKKLAETVSMITGVAISPMLGVGAVGAYDYYKAKTPAEKANLPWFANPLFFVPALLLVGACFLKDSAGIVIPTAL